MHNIHVTIVQEARAYFAFDTTASIDEFRTGQVFRLDPPELVLGRNSDHACVDRILEFVFADLGGKRTHSSA